MIKFAKQSILSMSGLFIFIFTLLFLFITQLFIYRGGNIYGIIDQKFTELNSSMNIWRYFFTWDSGRAIGEPQYLDVPTIFESIFTYILNFFTNNIFITNFLKIFLLQLFSIIGVIIFLYTIKKYLIPNWSKFKITLIWIISSLFIFNIYFFTTSSYFIFNQRYDILIFGLLFYSLNKMIYEKKINGIFIISSLLSIGCWSHLNFWLPFFAYLIVYLFIFNKSLKKSILITVLHLLLISPVIILGFLFLSDFSSTGTSINDYTEQVYQYANKNSDLLHIEGLISGVNWQNTWGWNNDQVFPYSKIFGETFFNILPYFILLIFLMLMLKFKKLNNNNKKFIAFNSIWVLICLFLIKANNLPFIKIFDFFIEKIPLFIIFRESHNKFMPLLIILLLGSIYILILENKEHIKKILIIVLCIYILLFGFLGFKYNIYSEEGIGEFPEENYLKLGEIIPPESRVLFLPEYSSKKRYDYGLTINSINRHLFDYSHFGISIMSDLTYQNEKVKLLLDNFNYKHSKSKVLKFGLENPSFDPKILNDLNIEYIVFDRQIIGDHSGTNFIFREETIKKLKDLEGFEIHYEDDFFIIFKSKEIREIINIKGDYKFTKNNPTEYELSLENISKPTELVLLESYHPGWKIRLNRVIEDNDYSERKMFLKNLITYPLFEETHTKTEGYANKWAINPGKIKEEFPEYFQENEDGSINIKLLVYYKPQTYLYMGILISILVSLLCGIHLIKSKRLNKITKK
jgi:hypothetical protein